MRERFNRLRRGASQHVQLVSGRQRLIVRSYGVFYPTDIGRYEAPVEYRHKARTEERLAIAQAAVALMADVGTVFLDEGALLSRASAQRYGATGPKVLRV